MIRLMETTLLPRNQFIQIFSYTFLVVILKRLFYCWTLYFGNIIMDILPERIVAERPVCKKAMVKFVLFT